MTINETTENNIQEVKNTSCSPRPIQSDEAAACLPPCSSHLFSHTRSKNRDDGLRDMTSLLCEEELACPTCGGGDVPHALSNKVPLPPIQQGCNNSHRSHRPGDHVAWVNDSRCCRPSTYSHSSNRSIESMRVRGLRACLTFVVDFFHTKHIFVFFPSWIGPNHFRWMILLYSKFKLFHPGWENNTDLYCTTAVLGLKLGFQNSTCSGTVCYASIK